MKTIYGATQIVDGGTTIIVPVDRPKREIAAILEHELWHIALGDLINWPKAEDDPVYAKAYEIATEVYINERCKSKLPDETVTRSLVERDLGITLPEGRIEMAKVIADAIRQRQSETEEKEKTADELFKEFVKEIETVAEHCQYLIDEDFNAYAEEEAERESALLNLEELGRIGRAILSCRIAIRPYRVKRFHIPPEFACHVQPIDGDDERKIPQEELKARIQEALRAQILARKEMGESAGLDIQNRTRKAPVPKPLPVPYARKIIEHVRKVKNFGKRELVRTWSREGHFAETRGVARFPKVNYLVAVDASGSMFGQRLEIATRIASWLKREDNVDCVTFDTGVYPWIPGTSIPGGGGTTCAQVFAYAMSRRKYDAIVWVTDGEIYDFPEKLPNEVPMNIFILPNDKSLKNALRDIDFEIQSKEL
jgi:predicted metal-dependent peptidase